MKLGNTCIATIGLALATAMGSAHAQDQLPNPVLVNIQNRGIDSRFVTCLDVPGGDVRSPSPLQMHQCHGGPNQMWIVTVGTDGFFEIKSWQTHLCLDKIPNSSDLQQYPCHGGDNQRWSIWQHPYNPFFVQIRNKANAYRRLGIRCISAPGTGQYITLRPSCGQFPEDLLFAES